MFSDRKRSKRIDCFPPKAGKTIMLQNIAQSITTNNPECHLIVLLIDERPEEVTEMARMVMAKLFLVPLTSPRLGMCRLLRWL